MFYKVERTNPLKIMTLEEAKQQLSIVDFNEDDVYIEALIATAGDMAERHTKTLYSEATVLAQMSEGVYGGWLPLNPVISITSVENGINPIDYKFNSFSGYIKLEAEQLDATEATIVTYQAGMVDVPNIIKHACKIIVSDLYENRESTVDAKMTQTIFNALRLLK